MLRVRAVASTTLLVALFSFSGCGPSNQSPAAAPNEPAASAIPSAAAAPSAPAAAESGAIDDSYPDPSKLLATDYASEADSGPARPGNSGLIVEVKESGPTLPWVVRITNQGNSPAELVADTRLLWFEVKVPGQKKTTTCRLPEQLGPTGSETRLRVTLNPSEGVADTFDPRLYCFAEGDQKLLVPGARVTAHFGWAEVPPKKLWKGGKRVEEPTLQKPPFVAKGVPAALPPDAAASSEAAETEEPATTAKPRTAKGKKPSKPSKTKATLAAEALAAVSDKELVSGSFTLHDEYAAWSRRPAPSAEPKHPEQVPDLAIHLVQGSDVRAEHNATVQLTVENPRANPVSVYFRREMVSFEVTGPRGITHCNAQPDEHSPAKRSFTQLLAHGKRTYTSRLAELCPLGTFSTPGLYLVHARFDATETGSEHGMEAFVGPVLSERPAAVRIRVGETPLLHKQMIRLNADGSVDEASLPPPPPPPPPRPGRLPAHHAAPPAPTALPPDPAMLPAAAPPPADAPTAPPATAAPAVAPAPTAPAAQGPASPTAHTAPRMPPTAPTAPPPGAPPGLPPTTPGKP